jgi:hypothetical protein
MRVILIVEGSYIRLEFLKFTPLKQLWDNIAEVRLRFDKLRYEKSLS